MAEDEEGPNWSKLSLSVEYMFDLLKNLDFSEILIRIAIFIVLVVITHWALKKFFIEIAIRILMNYFRDPILKIVLSRLHQMDFDTYRRQIRNYEEDAKLAHDRVRDWL